MQHIEAGDVAWVLVCTVLVLLMTIPGLALFYASTFFFRTMPA